MSICSKSARVCASDSTVSIWASNKFGVTLRSTEKVNPRACRCSPLELPYSTRTNFGPIGGWAPSSSHFVCAMVCSDNSSIAQQSAVPMVPKRNLVIAAGLGAALSAMTFIQIVITL